MTAREEITQKVQARLEKQIAFGGRNKRKTTDGEIILKCPIWASGATLEPLASDLTSIFLTYIEETSLSQIKSILKGMLE